MNLDRSELEDLTDAREVAREVLLQNPGIQFPLPLESLAAQAGIESIQILDPALASDIEGMLLTDQNKVTGKILYSGNAPYYRRRFTIAHELGHFLLPWHYGRHQFSCESSDFGALTEKAMEQEANQFAAELLMPTAELTRNLASTSSVQVAEIRRMARRFGTSLEMTARRIVETGRYRCAVVFSTGTFIRYAVESDSFKACIHALSSRRLPEDSLAATTTGQVDSSVEVVSKRWLFGVPGVDYPPTVNEQVCWQGANGAITLLTY